MTILRLESSGSSAECLIKRTEASKSGIAAKIAQIIARILAFFRNLRPMSDSRSVVIISSPIGMQQLNLFSNSPLKKNFDDEILELEIFAATAIKRIYSGLAKEAHMQIQNDFFTAFETAIHDVLNLEKNLNIDTITNELSNMTPAQKKLFIECIYAWYQLEDKVDSKRLMDAFDAIKR